MPSKPQRLGAVGLVPGLTRFCAIVQEPSLQLIPEESLLEIVEEP